MCIFLHTDLGKYSFVAPCSKILIYGLSEFEVFIFLSLLFSWCIHFSAILYILKRKSPFIFHVSCCGWWLIWWSIYGVGLLLGSLIWWHLAKRMGKKSLGAKGPHVVESSSVNSPHTRSPSPISISEDEKSPPNVSNIGTLYPGSPPPRGVFVVAHTFLVHNQSTNLRERLSHPTP